MIKAPSRPIPRLARLIVVPLVCLSAGACRAPLSDSSLARGLGDVVTWNSALDRKPWSEPRAGTTRGLLTLGLFSVYSADVVSTFGTEDVPMKIDMLGKFGLLLGRESHITDEVSVIYGLDYRFLAPGKPKGAGGLDIAQYFEFQDVNYLEGFIGARWNWDPLGNDRLRPYLLTKFGYVPSVKSNSTILYGDIPGSVIQDAQFDFAGSAYWNFGLGAGLQYELSEHAILHFGSIYEWPLSPSEDVVDVTLRMEDGTPWPPAPVATTMEPEGWMLTGGLTWTY